MASEKFTIGRRFGWGASLSVTIECDPTAPYGVKLGLAIKIAILSSAILRGADLSSAILSSADLRGADLRGAILSSADLRGADLSSAILSSADLRGADLRGADLRGEKIVRLIACVQRFNDQYTFFAFELEAGGVKIQAGCQWRTPASYRQHVADDYADQPKGAETLRILDFIESRMADEGIEPAKEPEA